MNDFHAEVSPTEDAEKALRDVDSVNIDPIVDHADELLEDMKVLSSNIKATAKAYFMLSEKFKENEHKRKAGEIIDRLFALESTQGAANRAGLPVEEWAMNVLQQAALDSTRSIISIAPELAERFENLAAARGKTLHRLTTSREVTDYITQGFKNRRF